ncbi:MAG TPA: hypothetical protein VHT92_07920 [Candidatus Cybelea sp.]|jgi:hypothetical protein|nr:hypothetical protein [Candidatus Cybelea sp.]
MGLPKVDALIAACVVFISVASLWVAVRSSEIQQKTLAASVWPYLEMGTSDTTDNGGRIILFTIKNQGVGPALVHWMVLSYRGRVYGDARLLLRACCSFTGPVITTTVHGRVIAGRESIDFIKVLPAAMSAQQFLRIDGAAAEIEHQACYCSVLDECWILASRKNGPAPVRSCGASPIAGDRL